MPELSDNSDTPNLPPIEDYLQELATARDLPEIAVAMCTLRLARAERAPDDIGRFKDANLGYIDDVLEALSWTRRGEEHEADAASEPLPEADWLSDNEPVVNPWRHVGRNDPCPCGSGKKAKRCCLK
jgi:hypothetical protein